MANTQISKQTHTHTHAHRHRISSNTGQRAALFVASALLLVVLLVAVASLSNLVWGGLGRPIHIEESKRTRHDDQDSIDEEDHIKALQANLGHLGLCERRNNHSSCQEGHKILYPKVLIIGTNHGGSTTISDILRHHPGMS